VVAPFILYPKYKTNGEKRFYSDPEQENICRVESRLSRT